MAEQRRGRKIAMSGDEMTEFLLAERTCRVATVGPAGPHATPLWFVWHDDAVWLYSLNRSQRWADLVRDPRIAVVIDAGHDYLELRGVEISGRVEVVGDVPRTSERNDTLAPVEQAFAAKYFGLTELGPDGRHAWLRVVPETTRSWDFRKLAGA